MEMDQRLREKFGELISRSERLKQSDEYGCALSERGGHACYGWLTSARNAVHVAVIDNHNAYCQTVDKLCLTATDTSAPDHVGKVAAILESLIRDIDAGLLTSVADQTRALVFDDFLDHAKYYIREQH